ncbi:hypothetical protein M8818_003904 [Zalaria obscura]|uniref:Uncharacterized protein n=1 Tax=Zalaria obscura TaxID=2024903 RepID=A0ACC3SDX1_9PEZI
MGDAPRMELMRSLNEYATTRFPDLGNSADHRRLYTAGQYSDLTIKCGKDTYKVHEAIVCTRSEVLASMCKENTFKVSSCVWNVEKRSNDMFQEGEQGIITLAARSTTNGGVDIELDNPQAVKSMITYFYTLDYPVSEIDVPPTNKANVHTPKTPAPGHNMSPGTTCNLCVYCPNPNGWMLHHADVYAAGDKYTITALKALSREKFRQTATMDWNSSKFIDCISKVYSTTPTSDRGLRNIIVDVCNAHSKCLLSKPEMQLLLGEMPDLAFELLNRSAGYKVSWKKRVRQKST